MARIWSDEGKLATWLEVEQAATAAWAELGVVPAEAAARIAEATPPAAERVAELEATLQHDTAAFVDAVAGQVGEEGRWLHYGLTSSDVVDTALSLQVREAGTLILAELDRAFAAVTARAEEHRETLQIGRTHGVHAEPTTFGLKLAGWAFELARGRERVTRALEGMRVGKLSGAVGTYAATDPELERLACERLGLEPAPSSPRRSTRSRSRSATSRAQRWARYRSRSAAVRRARRRCRTSGIRSSPSGSAGSPASSVRRRSSGSRTSPSGTSVISRTPRPSASRSPTPFLRSTTCSTASPGSPRASWCGPSGCAATSRRATSSSSANVS